MQGDYRLLVEISSYDNPTNRCEECGQQAGLSQTCCDAMQNSSCTGRAMCDNVFHYCLREPGAAEEFDAEPLEDCDPLRTTEVNRDGAVIDFGQSVVLGLPNPLSLTGLSQEWEVSVGSDVTCGRGHGVWLKRII